MYVIIISESRVMDASPRRKTKNTHRMVFNVAMCTYSIINSIVLSSEEVEEEWQRYDAGCSLQLPVWVDEACELSASCFICQYFKRSTTFNTASSG